MRSYKDMIADMNNVSMEEAADMIYKLGQRVEELEKKLPQEYSVDDPDKCCMTCRHHRTRSFACTDMDDLSYTQQDEYCSHEGNREPVSGIIVEKRCAVYVKTCKLDFWEPSDNG